MRLGLLGVYTPTLDYSYNLGNNYKFDFRIEDKQIVNQAQNQYFQCACWQGHNVMNLCNKDLRFLYKSSTSKYVGDNWFHYQQNQFFKFDVQNLQISALSYSGLFAYFQAQQLLKHFIPEFKFINSAAKCVFRFPYRYIIFFDYFTINIIYKNLNYTTLLHIQVLHSFCLLLQPIVFDSKLNLAVNSPSNIYFYSQLEGGWTSFKRPQNQLKLLPQSTLQSSLL
ncbi:Hypothetical_protein [Hexamita inflata]|uniref:Hypothetical_protein n=1 Tax=Hexamita inflata TaxID=28002 RepID=A0ABP1I8Z7_9EUKA